MWPFKGFATALPALLGLCCVLVVVFPSAGHGRSSVNIPADSRLYDDFEKLEVKGLLPSYMPATRPFDRVEGARLTGEAAELAGRDASGGTQTIIKRLQSEFASELSSTSSDFFRLKPVDNIYIKTLWAEEDPYFKDVNNNGDETSNGLNQRAGFVLTGSLFEAASFYINPEFRADENDTRGRIVEGYVKLDLAGLSLTVGKGSFWWGPGAHGSLLLTNNARPLEHVMLTSRRPFTLPWVFGRIGLVKPSIFVARLERERFYPRANLLGMRLDIKPAPSFRFALTRTIMFGGEGRGSLSLSDWAAVLIASDAAEHSSSPIDGNQLLSADASFVYVNDFKPLPFSGVKLYAEIGAEDSAGSDRTPKARGYLFGTLIDGPLWLRDFDLRVEYATTEKDDRLQFQQWYRHHVYKSGYTYWGRVMGHHMGPDASDLFFRVRYHHGSGATVAVEADFERTDVNDPPNSAKRSWAGVDIDLPLTESLRFGAGAGYERIARVGGTTSSNPVTWARLEYGF